MLYNEEDDRILVTIDDNIPFVEVDDNYSKSFTHEFYWLTKVRHRIYFPSSRNVIVVIIFFTAGFFLLAGHS